MLTSRPKGPAVGVCSRPFSSGVPAVDFRRVDLDVRRGMWMVVMALQVMALADNPSALSLVASCLAVAMLAFILVGGIVADRVSQRAIIIAVQSVNVAAVAAVSTLVAFGALRLWHGRSGGDARRGDGGILPAYSAYLPRILPPDQLLAANGVEGAIRPTLQQALGPAAAGMLVRGHIPVAGCHDGGSSRSACSCWPR